MYFDGECAINTAAVPKRRAIDSLPQAQSMMLQLEGPRGSDTDEDTEALLKFGATASSNVHVRQRAVEDVEETKMWGRLIASLRRLLVSAAVNEPPIETSRQSPVLERRTSTMGKVVKPLGVWLTEHPAGLYAR